MTTTVPSAVHPLLWHCCLALPRDRDREESSPGSGRGCARGLTYWPEAPFVFLRNVVLKYIYCKNLFYRKILGNKNYFKKSYISSQILIFMIFYISDWLEVLNFARGRRGTFWSIQGTLFRKMHKIRSATEQTSLEE
jgi:hypothetical protein